MGELEDSWTVLLGHQPTDHDKQNLYRIRDATKLKPTDAVWQLLIAFQYYEKLYEQFPARIAAMGMAAGENAAKKECAALVALSSWGLTPEGQVAYALAKAGGLADVARCTGRGMVPKDGWCTVQSERGKPLARWPVAPVGTQNSGAI